MTLLCHANRDLKLNGRLELDKHDHAAYHKTTQTRACTAKSARVPTETRPLLGVLGGFEDSSVMLTADHNLFDFQYSMNMWTFEPKQMRGEMNKMRRSFPA